MNIPNEVIEIVKKNLKNLIRAKAGSLVVILGPLLVIFLAGLAFDNSNTYAVKIGTYVPNQNPTITQFHEQLKKEFKLIEYNQENDCIESIKNSDTNTCMVFDANFTIGVQNKNQIKFYVDYSRINLVWTIMQTMTEEVGEQSLQASQSLTKVLLDTIDYTQQKIGEEKQAIVTLTTQNELMNKNTQELLAELGDIDLTFNENQFGVGNLTSAKTQVKQWVDNALSLGDKGLSKATSFIDTAHTLAKNSGVSGTSAENLLTTFQKTVDEMKKIQSDMKQTKNLTVAAFKNFDEQINALTSTITETKTKLNEADTSRQFSVRVLQAITELLDESLLSLSQVQNALNEIETRIDQIQIKDSASIAQPIVTTIKPITQEKTYLNYLFPILVVLIIMFTALLITPTLILLDKNSPASFRTYMTPVKDVSYVLATFITASLILFLQVIIILAISSIFFSTQIITNVPEALLLFITINSLFILIGMIIGYIFNSEETATLAAVSTGAGFLFISDVIIPLESMPEIFAYIASFNPYVLASTTLRRAILYDSTFLSILNDYLILVGYIIAVALITTGVYMLTRNYSLEKLMKNFAPVLAKFRRKK